jgi:hypothetical protein
MRTENLCAQSMCVYSRGSKKHSLITAALSLLHHPTPIKPAQFANGSQTLQDGANSLVALRKIFVNNAIQHLRAVAYAQ